VEGDPELAIQERAASGGIAQQLARVLSCLRQASELEPAQAATFLRQALTGLRIDVTTSQDPGAPGDLAAPDRRTTAALTLFVQFGLQKAKELALSDLDAFERRPAVDARSWAAWLAATTAEYRQWLARAREASRPPGD
jgi:hypothetical protein